MQAVGRFLQAGDAAGRLRHVPGLDVDAGLAFVANNVEVYTRLLTRFVHLHQQDVCELVRQAERADASGVQQLAHAIKGAAATLGVTALADLAHKLEQAAQQEQPAERMAELALAVRNDYTALGRNVATAAGARP